MLYRVFLCFIVFYIIVIEVEREENRSKVIVKNEASERETNIRRKDKKVEVSKRLRKLMYECQVLSCNVLHLESDRLLQVICLLLIFKYSFPFQG